MASRKPFAGLTKITQTMWKNVSDETNMYFFFFRPELRSKSDHKILQNDLRRAAYRRSRRNQRDLEHSWQGKWSGIKLAKSRRFKLDSSAALLVKSDLTKY